MFMGPSQDRRAQAILMLKILADRAEDSDVSLSDLGALAQKIGSHLIDVEAEPAVASRQGRLRVIEGGRP